MASNKKNIKELVTDDDDPTAELEVLTLHQSDLDVFESANIADLNSDLASRSETISRLQFDIERLCAKSLGLEAEIQSHKQVTRQMNTELAELKSSLKRKNGHVQKRNTQIKALRSEIRERNEAYRRLQEEFDTLNRQPVASADELSQQYEHILVLQSGQLASSELENGDLQQRYLRLEEYADQLRQQIQDRDTEAGSDESTREILQCRLQKADDRRAALESDIAKAKAQNTQLTEDLSSLHAAHTDEIRMIRFELGEAQDTVTEHALVAEQLASDLIANRTHRIELENMFSETEESSRSRIEELEKENTDLHRESGDLQQKLETKSEAVDCLMSELAKKTQQIASIGDMEAVIHEIDDRMSERIDDRDPMERDRVTRVLIGSIGDQELRFPLFKDRLTIGRTEQNDIQLKASHISRRHAVIVAEGSATRIIDWGSKNGVFVNSKRVTEHFLKNGDVVTVGTTEFRYEERPKRDA